MRIERKELLEALGNALYRHRTGAPPKEFARLRKSVREGYIERAVAVLRAADELGYRLASLPAQRLSDALMSDPDEARFEGFNECLELIDTVDPGELE